MSLWFLPMLQLFCKECSVGNFISLWRTITWNAKIECLLVCLQMPTCTHIRGVIASTETALKYVTVSCWQSDFYFPTVGWSRTSPRLCRTTQRNPDAVAPFNSKTLPHTSFWVLKSRHAGGGSRGTAELGCWELEGRNIDLISFSF